MEHRWNKRADRRFEVAVHRQGGPVTACRSCNVSLEGMFLDLDADAADLQVGSSVEVFFKLRNGKPGKQWHSNAVVMHRSPRGVGVMFSTFRPEVLAALNAAVNGRDVARMIAGKELRPALGS